MIGLMIDMNILDVDLHHFEDKVLKIKMKFSLLFLFSSVASIIYSMVYMCLYIGPLLQRLIIRPNLMQMMSSCILKLKPE